MNTKKSSKKYKHNQVENKWQKQWSKGSIYSPDIKKKEKKFYNLWMYPYPSAEGLHVGHVFASTGSDVYGRFMRMQGKDVFQPIGYDSFGLHSENFALKIKDHPKDMIARTTKHYEAQLKMVGHGYDWTKTVTTSDIEYYKWTQWLFVQLFKAGLAYRQTSSVNWCPSCKTVLADEQVLPAGRQGIAGECERCGHQVTTKELKQWFFRITDYADRLLDNLERIEWPAKIKTAQTNWIGKSEGVSLNFTIPDSKFSIETFTTRPDTLYGATFFVLSPEHPEVSKITASKYKDKVQKYIERAKTKSKEERIEESKNKTGIFTGGYVINPATDKKIPVYLADYVLMDYGTGAIMGVPAHDERDWEFAKANKLPVVEVISGGDIGKESYDGPGKLVNSGKWNGLKVPDQIDKVNKDVEKNGWGKTTTNYHLRDWLISRQRYWGPPIPMIFCDACAKKGKSFFGKAKKGLLRKDQSDWDHAGWYPEEKLPVELPYLKDYKPKGTGRGPLSDHPEFYETKCPSCGGKARRETDVSDTFVDSSWYFLRYPSVGSKTARRSAFDPEITREWLPVDLYFGGAEHSVLHLMYARFVWMVLYDLGYLNFPAKSPKKQLGGPATMPEKALGWDEPFPRFFAHGLLVMGGAKMSKSRGNVINPDEYVEKYGADALRLNLMFLGPMAGSPFFQDTGIEGMRRFVERVWNLFTEHKDIALVSKKDSREVLIKMHQTILKVTKDIEIFHYNTAISSLMEFVNLLREKTKGKTRRTKGGIRCAEWDEALITLAQLLAPFAPHITEEVWGNALGQKYSIHKSAWPKFDPELVQEKKAVVVIQVNGKLRGQLVLGLDDAKDEAKVVDLARKDKKIAKWLKGRKIGKVIFVPGKLINFVI